ncbi:MAG TPA: hypothetical protein VHB97_11050 [Polyangia bacterium]|nr:hypothetical protein [Polyangia bacterium]
MWFPIVVLIAQLSAAPAPVQRAYQKLTPAELEAKKTTKQPHKDAHKIDVSAKIRSASFGHKTWLIVAKDSNEFWVEYGRSTNTPAALYGPFTVEEAAKTEPGKAEPGKAEPGKMHPVDAKPGDPTPPPAAK